MILALLATASFAPPLDRPLRYETVEHRTLPGGEARATLVQTLRFRRVGAGLEAETIALSHSIDAPAPYRGLMEAPMGPGDGLATRVRLDSAGRITGVVDAAGTWAQIQAAERAHLARLGAEPSMPAATKAASRAAIEQAFFEVGPEARDARLADAFAALLPPPLPNLKPGERRAFDAPLRTPAGVLPSHGTITLERANAGSFVYQIGLSAAPQGTGPAIAALEQTLAAAATPSQKAKIAAAVEALKATTYRERTTLTLDGATGLLIASRTERLAEKPDTPPQLLELDETRQIP